MKIKEEVIEQGSVFNATMILSARLFPDVKTQWIPSQRLSGDAGLTVAHRLVWGPTS